MGKEKKLAALVFLILLVKVLAQEPDDYDKPEAWDYNDERFYQQIPPGQWDWDKVNWDKIDFSNPQIYSLPGFYQNLPENKYSQLHFKDKVDFSLIEPSKITQNPSALKKYLNDLGCSRCDLELALTKEGSCIQFCSLVPVDVSLTYSREGIQHEKGGFVSVGKYQDIKIHVTQDRFILLPEKIKKIDIPATDTLSIDTQLMPGEELCFEKACFQGTLTFEQGQIKVKKGDQAILNNIKIPAETLDQDIPLYFEETSVDFGIVLTEKKVSLYSHGKDTLRVEFLPQSSFNVEEGDKFTAYVKEGRLTLATDKEKNILDLEGQDLGFVNGDFDFHFDGQDLTTTKITDGQGFIPFSLELENTKIEMGNQGFGEGFYCPESTAPAGAAPGKLSGCLKRLSYKLSWKPKWQLKDEIYKEILDQNTLSDGTPILRTIKLFYPEEPNVYIYKIFYVDSRGNVYDEYEKKIKNALYRETPKGRILTFDLTYGEGYDWLEQNLEEIKSIGSYNKIDLPPLNTAPAIKTAVLGVLETDEEIERFQEIALNGPKSSDDWEFFFLRCRKAMVKAGESGERCLFR